MTTSATGAGGAGDERASQLERTTLSWQRTALAVGLNGALVLRLAVDDDAAWLWPVGVALLVVAVVVWVLALRAYRRLRVQHPGQVLLGKRSGLGLVALVVALSGVGVAAILLSPAP